MQKVPMVIEERYKEIVGVIEGFCHDKLNEKYLTLAKELCSELCSLENTSIIKGKANSWACGIVHALGLKNDLFNNKGEISIKAGDLYKDFEVSSSTGLSKSKEIRLLIDMENSRWSLETFNIKDVENEVAITVCDEEVVEEVSEKVLNNSEKTDVENRELSQEVILANEIVRKALGEKSYYKKAKLAKEALEISKDCVESYIILSCDNKLGKIEQKNLALEAVEAAKRIIGEENIEKYIGKFLEKDVSKGYYSSKYRLANILLELNERREAISEFKHLLEICPQDSLIIRGTLPSLLIMENMDEDVEVLLEKYKNDSLSAIKFTKALYLYKNNKLEDAERALRIANSYNPFVIDYIVRAKRIPKVLPEVKKLGTEEEAINYMNTGENAWRNVDGAINWVKEFRKKENLNKNSI